MQIMVRLINKFNSSSSSLEEKVAALFDLEYYVHQMDNAQDLLSFGGLQVVINGLNSTEPLVKEYAAFALGAAFSSNPKVQVEAVEGEPCRNCWSFWPLSSLSLQRRRSCLPCAPYYDTSRTPSSSS